MRTARYYIYRNLHTNTFSVRYKGKVIAHPSNFVAYNVEFKVNSLGRNRVLKERRKNVHAFIVAESWENINHSIELGDYIKYCPYTSKYFMISGNPIYNKEYVVGTDGKYIS